jgi:2-hydroxychromene-2-carboxylate isomerase
VDVEFFFDFASPYAYFASERIEPLCERLGVTLRWRPIVLGPIFKRTGVRPLLNDGVRGEYARMDCRRWARLHGVPYREPADLPTNSLKAARGALVLAGQPAALLAPAASLLAPAASLLAPTAGLLAPAASLLAPTAQCDYIHACFRAYWRDGKDLFADDTLAAVAKDVRLDVDGFFKAIQAPETKQRLIDATEQAWQLGVFGAPTFIVGNERLWGNDRLPLLELLIREQGRGGMAAGNSTEQRGTLEKSHGQ